MKLALFLSVLIESCLCWVTVKVSVSGVIRCSKPFNYSVNIWEEEEFYDHEVIGKVHVTKLSESAENSQNLGRFDIGGEAVEKIIFDNSVEPLMTVEHSCGTDYGCVCKKFPQTNVDFKTAVDLNLESLPSDISHCKVCDYAKKRRERAEKGRRTFGLGHYGGRG